MRGFIKAKGHVQMSPTKQLLDVLGTEPGGATQMFYGETVLKHMTPLMPFRDGVLVRDTYLHSGNTVISTIGDSAWFLYMGDLMVDPDTGSAWAKRWATKVTTGIPLQYNKETNPRAGPRWGERCAAEDGKQIEAETQDFINWRLRR